jgi:thiamine-phosphate diphosphorylase
MPNPGFQLHVITDGIKRTPELVDSVEKTLRGGADAIQLRYKSAPALDLWELGRNIQPIFSRFRGLFLINDRIDVALGLQADGVHLAGKSLPVQVAKRICGDSFQIGCSVHSVEEAVTAAQQGASYITFGHIFATTSKPGLTPRGIQALYDVVEAVNVPVLAIGGITVETLPEVLQTGCAGVAVIGAVMGKDDPEKASYEIKNVMAASSAKPKHPIRWEPREVFANDHSE